MTKKVYIIAGEPSGDVLGAKLMTALNSHKEHNLTFRGIGGENMANAGLNSLFPMSELSIMGFVELLPHIPKLMKRINQTVDDILDYQPDIVITIDSPGFSNRIAKKLQDTNITLIHYVAPTVWAYKPKRAEKLAKLYDALMVLLPFEPPYFEREGLTTHFVGHPIVEGSYEIGDENDFLTRFSINKNAKIITMLTGSRRTELKRLLPIYKQVVEQLSQQYETLHIILPTIETLKGEIADFSKQLNVPATVLTDTQDKKQAYGASDVALAKSGTATLELALAGLPMVVTYKVSPISAWLLRRMLRIDYANLINIIHDKMVIPEAIQEACNAPYLSRLLSRLLSDESHAKRQQQESQAAFKKLGLGDTVSPSEKAAKVVLGYLGAES